MATDTVSKRTLQFAAPVDSNRLSMVRHWPRQSGWMCERWCSDDSEMRQHPEHMPAGLRRDTTGLESLLLFSRTLDGVLSNDS